MKPEKFQILFGSDTLQIWRPKRPFMQEIPLAKVNILKLMTHLNNSPEWFCSFTSASTVTYNRILVEG